MIYFIQADGIGHIKIGFTDSDDAVSRLATLQTGSPVPLRVLHTMPGTLEDEKNLHRRFSSASVGGEWFKATTELLAMIPLSDHRKCEGLEVTEKSVSVRVLSVGRKQFSKSMLLQLPEKSHLDWGSWLNLVVSRHNLSESPSDVVQATPLDNFLVDDIWGWVDVGQHEILDSSGNSSAYRSVIHRQNNRLYRGRDYSRPLTWLVTERNTPHSRWIIGLLLEAHRYRTDLPGLTDSDQLFIGV